MPTQAMCQILTAQRLNARAFSLVLDAGDMAHRAGYGQFVHVACGENRILRRPISICDVSDETLRLVFEVRGAGTAWLAQRQVGDCLDVLGPLGHGFDLADGNVLLVGGGLGAPPLLGCAKGAGGRASAVLGFRSAEHQMLVDEFTASCRDVTLTSDDGSLGARGFVDAQVRLVLETQAFTTVLACGPKPMLKSVAKVAADFNVPCQVSMEERMGCGVGACLVCACKTADGHYRHVCKDGPVFAAGEVDFDA